MEHDDYSHDDAQKLIGKTFESLVEFPGVPRGSHGHVVEVDSTGDHWNIAIDWERPSGKTGNGEAPLRNWFTKEEVKRLLRELA